MPCDWGMRFYSAEGRGQNLSARSICASGVEVGLIVCYLHDQWTCVALDICVHEFLSCFVSFHQLGSF